MLTYFYKNSAFFPTARENEQPLVFKRDADSPRVSFDAEHLKTNLRGQFEGRGNRISRTCIICFEYKVVKGGGIIKSSVSFWTFVSSVFSTVLQLTRFHSEVTKFP